MLSKTSKQLFFVLDIKYCSHNELKLLFSSLSWLNDVNILFPGLSKLPINELFVVGVEVIYCLR